MFIIDNGEGMEQKIVETIGCKLAQGIKNKVTYPTKQE